MIQPVDRIMQIVDEVVNEINSQVFALKCKASWIDDPKTELPDEELKDLNVWVVDLAESSETQEGIQTDEFEVLLVVQRKINTSDDIEQTNEVKKKECLKLANFTNALTRHFRHTSIELPDGGDAACFKTERLRTRDFELYATTGVYRAEVSLHYRKMSDDDA